MSSVTKITNAYKQPRGGFLSPKQFNVVSLDDQRMLNPEESLHSTLIGIVVDYLARFMNGSSAEKAFRVSLKGSERIEQKELASNLIDNINGLDEDSIINACRLAGFDTVARAGPLTYKPIHVSDVNLETIKNIRIMVERCQTFFSEYGPITKDGFIFWGGYSKKITSGDGDFLTQSGLWDIKVSKSSPTNKHTLQLLVYLLMGLESFDDHLFEDLETIGVFNPRLNKIYTLPIHEINPKIILEVKSEVIGY